jgi:YVTN family beta-propeller protein
MWMKQRIAQSLRGTHARLLLALVMLSAMMTGCGASSSTSGPARIVATIRLDTSPAGGPVANGVWFLDSDHYLLAQVNPSNNRVVAAMPVPYDSSGLAMAGGALWLVRQEADIVERRDVGTGRIVASFNVFDPGAIAVTPGAVWIASGLGNTVTRLDLATNQVVATIPVADLPVGLAAGDGSLWVCSHHADEAGLWRIDSATNQVVAKIVVNEDKELECGGVEVAPDGTVWVVNGDSHEVPTGDLLRIDAQTNAVVASIPLPYPAYWGLAADTNALWYTVFKHGSMEGMWLVRADPHTNAVVGDTLLASTSSFSPVNVFLAGGGLWVQDGYFDVNHSPLGSATVWRLAPAP